MAASYIKGDIIYVVSNAPSRTEQIGLLMQIIIALGDKT